jgi:hypothetical protein
VQDWDSVSKVYAPVFMLRSPWQVIQWSRQSRT